MHHLLYHHLQLEAARLNYYEEHSIKYDTDIEGQFKDTQAPGDFSKYGDPIMDTLLNLSLEQMQTLTAKELIPTYSYHRLYTQGTELKRHKDRASCEISTTICIGYNSDYNWPMFISKQEEDKGEPVYLNPGDCIIYSGCDLYHWREPFKGKNHAQVFLHYNEKNGEFNNIYDNRKVLGVNPRV